MSADVRGVLEETAACPRMSAGCAFGKSERSGCCPRLSAGEKTAARPFGLSAVVRAVSKYVIHVCPRTYGCFLCFS